MHVALIVTLVLLPHLVHASDDPLGDARRFYNAGDYEAAEEAAREALAVEATRESARLVLGRIALELYRRSAAHRDLLDARHALRSLDASVLDERERAELLIGVGEYLFLEDRYGAATETFERALEASVPLGPAAHERVLDWWATALDRLALSRPWQARGAVYGRVIGRMEAELRSNPSSAPAAYWLPAALRGVGDLDRAWDTARAGWITALLGSDRGAALRADLDRLILQGIIPDRALKLQPQDADAAQAVMRAEWEALKTGWTR